MTAARRGQRLAAALGLCLSAVVLALALLSWFGGAILNGYARRKVERAYAAAHAGCALRIGRLEYALGANRLVAAAVTWETPDATAAAGRVALSGVRWARLLGRPAPAEAFAGASLEATGLGVTFPHAHYGIRTARLSLSAPAAELVAEGTELLPQLGDEALFATDAYRMTRYRVIVPECRVQGLAVVEALQGGALRAREVRVLRPFFDILVDREKPVRPDAPPPLMVGQALAAIRRPLAVALLSIQGGHLAYAERVRAGAAPGVLTFAALDLRAEDIANRGASPAIRLRAQARLMDAGLLKVLLDIPLKGPEPGLHYTGTLGAMDLTRLDAFLDRAEHTRIKSGQVDEVAFEVGIIAGQAHGQVRAGYRDLKMAVLDPKTGTEKGLRNRVASFLANTFKLRHGNGPEAPRGEKEGRVDYRKKPEDTFIQVLWFSLRSGVLDLIK